MSNFSNIIAKALHIGEPYVLNTLALIDEGATIPFISRYRKEKTGGMDEVQIGQIDELYSRLKETRQAQGDHRAHHHRGWRNDA